MSSSKANASKACIVCDAAGTKYKCSGCRAPYCSVACYGVHKTGCNVKQPIRAAAPVPGLVRNVRKRPYQQEREEISYSATPAMLEQMMTMPDVQAIVHLLRQRDAQLRARLADDQKAAAEEAAEREDGSSSDGPPEVKSSKKEEPAVAAPPPAAAMSIDLADRVSRMNHLADVVTHVCNASSLERKRAMLEGFLSTDEDVDAFCDAILRLTGARDEESHFVLH